MSRFPLLFDLRTVCKEKHLELMKALKGLIQTSRQLKFAWSGQDYGKTKRTQAPDRDALSQHLPALKILCKHCPTGLYLDYLLVESHMRQAPSVHTFSFRPNIVRLVFYTHMLYDMYVIR